MFLFCICIRIVACSKNAGYVRHDFESAHSPCRNLVCFFNKKIEKMSIFFTIFRKMGLDVVLENFLPIQACATVQQSQCFLSQTSITPQALVRYLNLDVHKSHQISYVDHVYTQTLELFLSISSTQRKQTMCFR